MTESSGNFLHNLLYFGRLLRAIGIDVQPDGVSNLVKATASITVPPGRAQAFRSTITPPEGDAKTAVKIGGDRELHMELVAQLQAFESDVSFVSGSSFYGLQWNKPEANFIPESSQDEQLLAVSSFSFQREYPQDPVFITMQAFTKIVTDAPKQEEWLIHKAFFREAMEFFRTFSYIQAFYGFYFILEDLFFHGKSREVSALKEIAKSKEFAPLARKGFDSVMSHTRHRQNIETLCQQLGVSPALEDVAKLLFRARGALHHFHQRSSRPQPIPSNQDDFESIALFAMEITTRAIADRTFDAYGPLEGVRFPE